MNEERGIVRKGLESLYAIHYNVHFKSGKSENRVTERAITGLRPVDLDWVWIVERRRRATPVEIRRLCKGSPKPSSGEEWEGEWR